MMSGDSEEYDTDSEDESSQPASETPSLPDFLDEEEYPAADVFIHSTGTGADTDEKKEAAPAIRQALRTKVSGLQLQAGMVESSTTFHEKLIGDLSNKVDVLAAQMYGNFDEIAMKYGGINNNYQKETTINKGGTITIMVHSQEDTSRTEHFRTIITIIARHHHSTDHQDHHSYRNATRAG